MRTSTSNAFANIIAGLVVAVGGIFVLFLFSAIGGFVVNLLWPLVIPKVFPGAVASGAISGDIGFWAAYGLTFITGILFKSSKSSSSSKSD